VRWRNRKLGKENKQRFNRFVKHSLSLTLNFIIAALPELFKTLKIYNRLKIYRGDK